ncbi:thymocyte nuclear protein 1 [Clupea harengus]|uniref:Thymocyte nuclear protein 1 n=1 Tax=Clupea harengus TaxID=7950 RepID=A0A6P3W1L8_CLUHA|nr:thymocyte nuclear protein 1 [Clupea harengus]
MPPRKRARGPRNTTKTVQADSGSEDNTPETATRSTGKRKTAHSGKSRGKEASKAKDSPSKASYSHWLMKSEPESRFQNGIDMKFGIEDLKALPNQTDCWDGVRNYQARNFMRDMKVGHQAFFYHSNCKEPGVAGLMKIVKEAYVDHTQFDKKDVHYDASSKPDNPKWSMVDVQYERTLTRYVSLAELKKLHLEHKAKGGPLRDMALFTRARLSVQPLTAEEFNFVLSMEDKEPL